MDELSAELSEMRERSEKTREQAKQLFYEQMIALVDDARYTREVLNAKGTLSMSAMAKELGMNSAQALTEELEAVGILYQNGSKEWLLKSNFTRNKLTVTRTVVKAGKTVHYLVWTEKGRRWLHALVDRCLVHTAPKPKAQKEEPKEEPKKQVKASKSKEVKSKEVKPKAEVIIPKSNSAILLSLISEMEEHFECLVTLAKDCVKELDSRERKLLVGDIRSINDSTSIIMRRLERECYDMLAV